MFGHSAYLGMMMSEPHKIYEPRDCHQWYRDMQRLQAREYGSKKVEPALCPECGAQIVGKVAKEERCWVVTDGEQLYIGLKDGSAIGAKIMGFYCSSPDCGIRIEVNGGVEKFHWNS